MNVNKNVKGEVFESKESKTNNKTDVNQWTNKFKQKRQVKSNNWKIKKINVSEKEIQNERT